MTDRLRQAAQAVIVAECLTCAAVEQPENRRGNFTGYAGRYVPKVALLLTADEASAHQPGHRVVYE